MLMDSDLLRLSVGGEEIPQTTKRENGNHISDLILPREPLVKLNSLACFFLKENFLTLLIYCYYFYFLF